MTLEQLMQATGASRFMCERYLEPLNAAMERFNISTPEQKAAFIATITIETGRLKWMEESLFYRNANRLANIFKRVFNGDPKAAEPYIENPLALSEKLYNGYHGRGMIQLTWEKNYKACSDALGVDFVAEPKLLRTPEYAALSAAWFWHENGCNDVADDMTKVTRIVNGPALMHLKERQQQYDIALVAFKDEV
jgi:putative chitinase